jgi:hypothetical protein
MDNLELGRAELEELTLLLNGWDESSHPASFGV